LTKQDPEEHRDTAGTRAGWLLGVVVFSGKGRRLTTAWILGLSTFVVGGYWYVRAAIKTGGPGSGQVHCGAKAGGASRTSSMSWRCTCAPSSPT